MREWQKNLFVRLLPGPHGVLDDRGLAAELVLILQALEDAPRRVALLLGSLPVATVPEPGALAVVGCVMGLGAFCRRR
jgi:hypothetical protein